MIWTIVAATGILGLLGIWPLQQYLGELAFIHLLVAIVLATILTISGRRAAR